MKPKYKKWTLITLFWLLLWQVLAMAVDSVLLLPGPVDTAKGLFVLLSDTGFYLDAAATVGRCAAAVALSLIAGILLALASYRWSIVRDILSLPVSLFKTIPIMAVAIYMILLMSAGSVPVLVCWVMCFPIVYTNLLAGLDALDKDLLEMSGMYGITGWNKVRYLYVPSLYPQFKAAMSLVAGMSWKAIVTAEVLSIPEFSLGYELMNSKYYLNTDQLFAYVAVIILLSVVFEKLIRKGVAMLAPAAYEGSKIKNAGKAKNAGMENAGKAKNAGMENSSDKEKNANGRDVAASPATVKLDSVVKKYGDKVVLDGFSMKLAPGTITALMSPSGSGKTTVAGLISGLETADAGSVHVNGSVSFLFQEDRLLPWLNVYDNLAIICNDKDRIKEMLDKVGLGDDLWKMPDELSGGMSRRVAIVRAFLYDGGLLIADEPFRGLDDETRASVIENLWKESTSGRTVLLITHSEADASELADSVIKL